MKNEILNADELNLVTLAQQYSDEDKARDLLESILWPDGPVCPHCKNHKEKAIYRCNPKRAVKPKSVRAFANAELAASRSR